MDAGMVDDSQKLLDDLQQYVFCEFPAKIAEQGKENALQSYLAAIKALGFINSFFGKIKCSSTKEEVKDYLKETIGLPLGLRNLLATGCWDVVKGWGIGHIVYSTFYVTDSKGEDDFGPVYKVIHLGWNKPMIAKIGSKLSREQFTQKAELWIGLGLHPHVSTALFVRVINNQPCIFVENYEGSNLLQLISPNSAFYLLPNVNQLVYQLFISIAWAIEYAHSKNTLHLNMKPENIICEQQNTTADPSQQDQKHVDRSNVQFKFKVAEFGSLPIVQQPQLHQQQRSRSNSIVDGTTDPANISSGRYEDVQTIKFHNFGYMSPECYRSVTAEPPTATRSPLSLGIPNLINIKEIVTSTRSGTTSPPVRSSGADISSASDVYSLGIIFLDVIRGQIQSPIQREEYCSHYSVNSTGAVQALIDEAFNLSPLPRMVLLPLKNLLQLCLSCDPARRPTAEALGEQLVRIYAQVFRQPYPRMKPRTARSTVGNLNNQALSAHELGRSP